MIVKCQPLNVLLVRSALKQKSGQKTLCRDYEKQVKSFTKRAPELMSLYRVRFSPINSISDLNGNVGIAECKTFLNIYFNFPLS